MISGPTELGERRLHSILHDASVIQGYCAVKMYASEACHLTFHARQATSAPPPPPAAAVSRTRASFHGQLCARAHCDNVQVPALVLHRQPCCLTSKASTSSTGTRAGTPNATPKSAGTQRQHAHVHQSHWHPCALASSLLRSGCAKLLQLEPHGSARTGHVRGRHVSK